MTICDDEPPPLVEPSSSDDDDEPEIIWSDSEDDDMTVPSTVPDIILDRPMVGHTHGDIDSLFRHVGHTNGDIDSFSPRRGAAAHGGARTRERRRARAVKK